MIEAHATAKYFLGMPPAKLLRDYWQKRPLLIRNAFPDFVAPLSPEAGLVCENGALSRIVAHERSTTTGGSDRWLSRPVSGSLVPNPMRDFIAGLTLPADARQRLLELTPDRCTGLAERLAADI